MVDPPALNVDAASIGVEKEAPPPPDGGRGAEVEEEEEEGPASELL